MLISSASADAASCKWPSMWIKEPASVAVTFMAVSNARMEQSTLPTPEQERLPMNPANACVSVRYVVYTMYMYVCIHSSHGSACGKGRHFADCSLPLKVHRKVAVPRHPALLNTQLPKLSRSAFTSWQAPTKKDCVNRALLH